MRARIASSRKAGISSGRFPPPLVSATLRRPRDSRATQGKQPQEAAVPAMAKHRTTGVRSICARAVWTFGLAPALLVYSLSGDAWAQAASKPLPTLTNADQIRHLTPEQASQGYPVRIRGVVTMDAPAPDFFVQDATAGIYAEGNASPRYPHVLGQLVEVEGITGPGRFAPVIREQRLRVLGKGVLPKAQLFSLAELSNGQHDSQWAQV